MKTYDRFFEKDFDLLELFDSEDYEMIALIPLVYLLSFGIGLIFQI